MELRKLLLLSVLGLPLVACELEDENLDFDPDLEQSEEPILNGTLTGS